jgi:hypothetical protein
MIGHHENWTQDDFGQPPSEWSFGITIGMVLILVSVWLAWSKEHLLTALLVLALGAIHLSLAFLRPSALGPLNRLWFRFGLLIHRLVSPIVLGALFYIVFTPAGLLLRIVGHDFMRRRKKPQDQSYWIMESERTQNTHSMHNQF